VFNIAIIILVITKTCLDLDLLGSRDVIAIKCPLDSQFMVCCGWSVVMVHWQLWCDNKIRIAIHCCALLIFSFQFQMKVLFCTQFSERVWHKKCIRSHSSMGFWWTSGVNNSKVMKNGTRRTKLTKERHIFSTTQDESDLNVQKGIPCAVIPWHGGHPMSTKMLFLGKATS